MPFLKREVNRSGGIAERSLASVGLHECYKVGVVRRDEAMLLILFVLDDAHA